MNLLKNKVFMTILATDIIQQMAIWIRNLSIMFFIMDVTNNDPIAISWFNFIQFLPMFLLTFVGGIIADKYNPKKLMFIGDFLSLVSFIILGFLISKGVIIAVFIAVLISAVVTQFSYPASQKYFKEYVEEDMVESAIGISQLLSSGFCVIGPFIGSYFYFNFGIDNTLFIISALLLVSIGLILTLPKTEFAKVESSGMKEDIILTIKYIKEKYILKIFIIEFFLLAFAIGISSNLDIFLVTERLGLDEKYYQFFSGIAGVGVIVGGVIYVVISKYTLDLRVLYLLMGVCTVTVFIEGYSTSIPLTMALQFIDNVIGSVCSGYVAALLTKITDQEYLGKVNGLSSTLMFLGVMLGTLISGPMMKYVSIVFAFSIASLGYLCCTIILYRASKKSSTKI